MPKNLSIMEKSLETQGNTGKKFRELCEIRLDAVKKTVNNAGNADKIILQKWNGSGIV